MRDELPDDYGTPEYETRWIREKLNLPPDARTSDMQGHMHVICSEAHGYDTYVKAYKCDDKQGEIARLTVEVKALREELDNYKIAEKQWETNWDSIGEANAAGYNEAVEKMAAEVLTAKRDAERYSECALKMESKYERFRAALLAIAGATLPSSARSIAREALQPEDSQ